MDLLFALAVATVIIVVFFDFTNGFHDAANIVATVISSRAMTPVQAVVVVGTFEFLGPLLGGTAVANTIGKFITLDDVPAVMGLSVLFCGLLGAIVWNPLTWWKGIPSSSHALIGGLAGAVVVAVGADHVVWGFHQLATEFKFTGVTKVLLALVLSPIIGFWAGFLIHRGMLGLLRAAKPSANHRLRLAQFVTSAGLAFSHGANDAQKSMSILTLVLLLLGGFIDRFEVPFWVMLVCAGALTLGIMSGGWRIVRTLGFAIYRVRPIHALDSQLTSAAVIFGASMIGAPVSTTHVVATSIMGIGASERPKAVRWAKAREIAKRLQEGVAALAAGFNKLKTAPGAAAADADIARKSERRVEKLYRKALGELFAGDDFRNMFKRREIYRHLSNAADRMANCANTLHDIVVKMC